MDAEEQISYPPLPEVSWSSFGPTVTVGNNAAEALTARNDIHAIVQQDPCAMPAFLKDFEKAKRAEREVAALQNQIVRLENKIIRMQGARGVRVHRSEGADKDVDALLRGADAARAETMRMRDENLQRKQQDQLARQKLAAATNAAITYEQQRNAAQQPQPAAQQPQPPPRVAPVRAEALAQGEELTDGLRVCLKSAQARHGTIRKSAAGTQRRSAFDLEFDDGGDTRCNVSASNVYKLVPSI